MKPRIRSTRRIVGLVPVLLTVLPAVYGFSSARGLGANSPCTQPQARSFDVTWRSTKSVPPLFAIKGAAPEDNGDESVAKVVKVDPVVKETAVLLRRLSWLTWWSQLILTTVSSVTILFARNVIGASTTTAASAYSMINASLPNFVLAGLGIGLSFTSIFWTWASRRLARRLLRKPTKPFEAAAMLRKSITVGVTLNLFGMLTSLISAEQIVGALAIKVLTSAPARTTVALLESSSNYLQPLDILVVQANTNTLFSHFSSLAALLYMTKSLAKLDPPSSKQKL